MGRLGFHVCLVAEAKLSLLFLLQLDCGHQRCTAPCQEAVDGQQSKAKTEAM